MPRASFAGFLRGENLHASRDISCVKLPGVRSVRRSRTLDCGSPAAALGEASLLAGKDGSRLGKLSIYRGVTEVAEERGACFFPMASCGVALVSIGRGETACSLPWMRCLWKTSFTCSVGPPMP